MEKHEKMSGVHILLVPDADEVKAMKRDVVMKEFAQMLEEGTTLLEVLEYITFKAAMAKIHASFNAPEASEDLRTLMVNVLKRVSPGERVWKVWWEGVWRVSVLGVSVVSDNPTTPIIRCG